MIIDTLVNHGLKNHGSVRLCERAQRARKRKKRQWPKQPTQRLRKPSAILLLAALDVSSRAGAKLDVNVVNKWRMLTFYDSADTVNLENARG